MAAVRKSTNKTEKNNSLNCTDAKSYLSQAATKNDASLYVLLCTRRIIIDFSCTHSCV